MLNKIIKSLAICLICLPAFVYAQDPLGDTDSFGTNVKFAGSATSGTVYFAQTCQPPPTPLGAEDRCLNVNSFFQIHYDYKDLGKIVFPPNTFQNVIYPQIKNTLGYYFTNPNNNGIYTHYNYRPYITFESPVLFDPTLINPLTGQPFKGKIDISLPNKEFHNTLVGNGIFSQIENYSTNLTNGLNKKFFMNTYGLSQTNVDNIFAGKIGIKLNMRGTVATLYDGYAQYSIRFLGN
jgi:hypothetical protein